MPHPHVVIRMLKGSPLEQKRTLVKDITETVVKNFGCPAEIVTIELEEFSPENLSEWTVPPASGTSSSG